MTTTKPQGAQFEISIDGTPRTYRDDKAMAIEAAEILKRKHPHGAVTVENVQTGEKTAARRNCRLLVRSPHRRGRAGFSGSVAEQRARKPIPALRQSC